MFDQLTETVEQLNHQTANGIQVQTRKVLALICKTKISCMDDSKNGYVPVSISLFAWCETNGQFYHHGDVIVMEPGMELVVFFFDPPTSLANVGCNIQSFGCLLVYGNTVSMIVQHERNNFQMIIENKSAEYNVWISDLDNQTGEDQRVACMAKFSIDHAGGYVASSDIIDIPAGKLVTRLYFDVARTREQLVEFIQVCGGVVEAVVC